MGAVVAFVSQKGGVGKSTLARALAREAAAGGHVYMVTGELVQACKYLQNASKIADVTGNRQNPHEARFGLALAHLYAGDLAAARKAIDGARQYDYPTNTAASWTATGCVNGIKDGIVVVR